MHIFLYGVPGVGKSTVSAVLAKKLGVDVFYGDDIREEGKLGKSVETDPFYFLPTTEAYKVIGERSPENVIKGFLAVREAYVSLFEEKIREYKDGSIIECAFLTPLLIKEWGKVILLHHSSEMQHRKQFMLNRNIDSPLVREKFENARWIQDYLLEEKRTLIFPAGVDTNGTINTLTERILAHL